MDDRKVFFFDIDNCLYSRNTNVIEIMGSLINKFFVEHLSLSKEDAHTLHQRYYREYGLAIEGLARHHDIDPLEFNSKVDDAIPLDDILKPDPALKQLLEDFDTTKVKLWLFTNAYITHGQRVVRLLGIDHLFEGITYCDYATREIVAKPQQRMFEKAMREANVDKVEQCLFVDDSGANIKGAINQGWTAVHFVEPQLDQQEAQAGKYRINSLQELRGLFPDIFKQNSR